MNFSGNGFACVASCLTLSRGEITDGIQLLISSRTISRIDFDPMSGIQTTARSDVSFDTIAKGSCGSLYGSEIPTRPITNAIFVDSTNVIQKRIRMSPTMTGIILSDDVKRTTLDD
jgi:hypothetical protein